jgi:hypothetical protein
MVRRSKLQWRWFIAALVAAAIVLAVLLNWQGTCVDYAPGSTAEGQCVTEPLVGLPGALVIGAFGSVFIVFAVVRWLRRERG